jgi:hypothetical protein
MGFLDAPALQGPPGAPGAPGAPGGSDASFAAWINDVATPSLTRSALGGAFEPLTTFALSNYDAVEDGIADDTTAFRNAALAAYNAGGGVVTFTGTPLITDYITAWENVTFMGIGTSLSSLDKSTIILDGATAQVRLGNGVRGGHSANFSISVTESDPTGALKITATEQKITNISVDSATGIGAWIYGSQNCHLDSVGVSNSGTDNVVVDGGTGGMLYSRCEWMSAAGYNLRITDSAPGGHTSFGYQYGPAHNHFVSCLMESYSPLTTAEGLVLVEAGSRNTFRNCGISNSSDLTFTGDGGVLAQVRITNDKFPTTVATSVEFNSCNFTGGNTKKYPPIYVQGTNAVTKNCVTVNGSTFFNGATHCFVTDGPTEGHIEGTFTYTNVSALYNAIGAGSFFFWRQDRSTGIFVKMPDATAPWGSAFPFMCSRDNDAGARFIVTNLGDLVWASGGNFTPIATFGYVSAAGALHSTKGLSVSGKILKTHTDSIPATGAAVTTDASVAGPVYLYTLTGTGSIASWTISNPYDGQEIRLGVYRVGTQTMVWPPTTLVRYESNTAPATPATGTISWVTLYYLASTGKWYEVGRAIDTPV